jgi:hypothetical protein
MRIIDKNKDFYDYFQEYDSDIVFDRRNSHILTNEELNVWMLWSRHKADDKYFLLQIGYTNWLILAKPTKINQDDYGGYTVEDFSLELVEMWKDYDKSVDFKFGEIKTHYTLEYLTSKKFNHKTALIDDIKLGNFEYKNNFTEKSLIVLNKTKLPSILNAQDVYLAIEEWLSHKKDDIVHDSMTDKEKIVSHGFDTKESFRGKIK